MSELSQDVKTALVLQGGGALGAYQYGAVKCLYEKYPEFVPCIVTGVSIGAINASLIVGGKHGPVKSLELFWNALEMPVFPLIPQEWQSKASKLGNPAMYTLNPMAFISPMTATNVYDLAPLRALLTDLIDLDKLNNNPNSKLVVEAVNVETGELAVFQTRSGYEVTLDHIMASLSIPPNFPAMYIKENYYWDGGLFSNMPLSPAINFLENVGDEKTERNLIVINLFRKNSTMPTNFNEITQRIQELMFESKLNLDWKFFEKMNDYVDLIQAINAALPADSTIREMPGYKDLIRHRKINNHAVLQYEAEGVVGTDDFTPDKIDLRIRTGFRDMEQVLHSYSDSLQHN